jgi:hypothetical protein
MASLAICSSRFCSSSGSLAAEATAEGRACVIGSAPAQVARSILSGIGIEARVAVCQEALQPLIDQLSISVVARRAVLPSRPLMPWCWSTCPWQVDGGHLTGRRLNPAPMPRALVGVFTESYTMSAAAIGGTSLAPGRNWRLPRELGPLSPSTFCVGQGLTNCSPSGA